MNEVKEANIEYRTTHIKENQIELVDELVESLCGKSNTLLPKLCNDSYYPTPSEEKLLLVLADPSNRLKSVKEVCEIARIDIATYYRAFAKEGFQQLNLKLGLEIIKREAQPLINIGMKYAREGSYKHWEALLKMGGLLTDKQEIKHIHSIEQQLAELDD